MKAVVIHKEHDLRIEDVAVGDPGPGEVRIRVKAGGICGSDLHYYHHAGFGTVRVREPMILGHEAAGEILALGDGVSNLTIGQRVAINPSRPSGDCEFMRDGMRQHAMEMRFNGSAMRFPHVQGLFRQQIVVEAEQAVPVGVDTPFEEAACCEPLAVCLHAIEQAGSLVGKRVLVTGTGTIGCLTILAARFAGASEIVATDISSPALEIAKAVGADVVLNTAEQPDALAPYAGGKGTFHAAFECSGNGAVMAGLLNVVRPRGTIVAVGLGKEVSLPISAIVTKEIVLRGTFRFDHEFAWAARLIANRRIDVRPLLTAQLPIDQAVKAFELASDRVKSMKVHLLF
ncbi:L-idonate 5-dehydrogenase [Rhizobium sp. CFBP 8762]|uniref:L-idonate 5-dehydrogenase n=1 Tax=Rhizobium sp. CFBP 8762 TaxID=2775279 RepID=UPI00177CD673|nr:L-idonate 5-dehydrogenase [Rhizobium sp. CFBP 8762]MBD8556089.1 L-idonate 5-dehydrogenase [Rhizobium sp. CFBP 8762]